LSGFAGLLTYRYLNLYSYGFREASLKIRNYTDLIRYDREENFMDIVIRKENLHENIAGSAEKLGMERSRIVECLAHGAANLNASNRKEYAWYYDEKSKNLVAGKEQLVIDKYSYVF
jgi:hypothetical protein